MDRVTHGFVISAPRSGSTWLMRALSAHPHVHATEHRLFGPHHDEVIDEGADRPRLRITLDRFADAHARHLNLDGTGLDIPGAREALIRRFADALLKFDRAAAAKPVIIDKVTPYPGTASNVFDRLTGVFPNAPVVGLVRDGRDVVTSGAHHWLNKRLAGEGPATAPTADRFLDDEIVRSWATLWDECTAAALRAPTRIRYESMLDDMPAVLEGVFRALGVPAAAGEIDACVAAGSFERASGGRARGVHNALAHARSGVRGDWRRVFTRRDGEVFDAVAGETLESLGYADRGWWRTLPETLRQTA
ncbi:MAG: sulfotransferase [Phycisphaerales bacterium]